MKAAASSRFQLYRYQILPRDRHFQGDLLGFKSLDELLAHKNEVFAKALESVPYFRSSRSDLATELLWKRDGFYLYRVAADRSITRETRDFKKETLDNWPSILVALWNHPDQQLLAIQRRTSAFQTSEAVVSAVAETLAPYLYNMQLVAVWEPLIEKAAFWDLVARHKGELQEIEFEIVTPNMANISKVLPENLRDFAKHTNAIKSKVAIEAEPSSSLKVDKGDPTLNGLVAYASEGGGNISIRIAGYRKKLQTARTVREVEISELDLEGEPSQIAKALQEILK